MQIAALNNIFASNIQNAYLTAHCSEKKFTICGPEFRSDNCGKIAVIGRALYGHRAPGAAFGNFLAKYMTTLK